MGTTALITGASSGLGAAFARKLAARGQDVVLVARRRELLESVASEALAAGAEHAEVLVADLCTEEGIRAAEDRITGCADLEVLVNNAGFGVLGSFASTEARKQVDLITLHTVATTRLCHAALRGMLERGRGAIINVASVSAVIPLAGNVSYSGTKAYLAAFTEALSHEIAGRGVKLQVLLPGFTRTGFHETEEYRSINVYRTIPGWLWMDAEQCVEASLRDLERGRLYSVPGWHNKLLVAMARHGLGRTIGRVMARSMRRRKRATAQAG